MRILVTGAAGFVASHLAERLAGSGHQVVGIDCFTDYYARELKECNAADVEAAGAEIQRLDLAVDDLEGALEGVEVVYHLAAQPGISATTPLRDLRAQQSHRHPLPARSLRGQPVARTLRQRGHLVGLRLPGHRPGNQPGAARLPLRRHQARRRSHGPGLPRNPAPPRHQFPTLLGLRPPGATGENSSRGSSAPSFKTNPSLSTRARGPTRARSPSRATLSTGSSRRSKIPGSAPARSSTSDPMPNSAPLDGIRIVEEILGRKARIENVPGRPGDQLRTAANIDKIRDQLGYAPRVGLEEGLRETVAWFQERLSENAAD